MPARSFSRVVRSSIVVIFVAALAVIGGLTFTGGTRTDATGPSGALTLSGSHSLAPSSAGPGTRSAVDVADTASAKDPVQGVLEYLHTRQGVVQVALFDKVTGKTYLVSDGTNTQYTASIVKADILARWLKQLQGTPGSIPSNVPYSVQYLMSNMITMSDNSAATSLFYFGGGCDALTQFNRAIPTNDTKVGCESPTYYGWGNTTTTAADQVNIVRTLAYDNNILTTNARDYGLHLMESVIPAQRWGVTCGPWGTACEGSKIADPVPGVTVALKNGWKYDPTCIKQDESCPWQVNSMGWVQGKDRDYVLAVLTTDDPVGNDPKFDYGIATIQGVSLRVWENLAP
jgi:hypothetical protein